MMEKIKISPHQFKLLVILIYIGSSILFEPGALAADSKQDAWIPAILGVLGGLLLVLFFNSLAKNMGNITLVEYSEKLLGKWLGGLMSLLFIVFLFLHTATLVYVVGSFLTTQMMHEIPIEVANLIFIIIIVIGVRLGLETFSRSAEMLYPVVLGIFTIFIILLCKDMDLINFQPVFEAEIKPIMKGSFIYISYSSLVLVSLLMIYPANVNNCREAKKSFYSGVVIGGIIIFIVTFVCISVLGGELTSQSRFSTFILAKRINVGNFVRRIESLITILWFITVFFKTIIFFYGAVLGFAQTFKMKDYKPLTIPFGIFLAIFSTIIYPNSVYATNWGTTTRLSFNITFCFFLPLILLLIDKVKNKMRKSNT